MFAMASAVISACEQIPIRRITHRPELMSIDLMTERLDFIAIPFMFGTCGGLSRMDLANASVLSAAPARTEC